MVSSSRAAPLPPDQRRAAIVAAARPLVCRRGATVTTREIAEAAGIAEGTIFRVFEDKDSLLVAVIADVLDPAPTAADLRAIDPTQPLDAVIGQAIEALRRRLESVWQLVGMLRMHSNGHEGGHEHGRHFTPISRPDLAAIQDALADLLLAHRHELRWPPHKAARLVHLVTVASTHPILTDDQPFTTDEILDLLVHGVTADEPTVADEPMAREPTTADEPEIAGVGAGALRGRDR